MAGSDANPNNAQTPQEEERRSPPTEAREQPLQSWAEEKAGSPDLRTAHREAGLDPRDLEYLDATPIAQTSRSRTFESSVEVPLTNEATPHPAAPDPWLSQDSNGDGLTNQGEVRIGTDPNSADTDRDGVSDYQEVVNRTNPFHHDTDRDGVPDGEELRNGTNPNAAERVTQEPDFETQLVAAGVEPELAQKVAPIVARPDRTPEEQELVHQAWEQVTQVVAESNTPGTSPEVRSATELGFQVEPTSSQKRSLAQDPAIPSLDAELEKDLPDQPQLPGSQLDIANESIADQQAEQQVIEDVSPEPTPAPESETRQPSFIDTLYQRLEERSGLELNNVTVSVYQGPDLLYRGSPQSERVDHLTPEQHDLLQQTLDDPSGLQGELTITVNKQVVFHVDNGELKIDHYGLAGRQRAAQTQAHADTPAQTSFDASAVYQRYQQEVHSESPVRQAPIDVYEGIGQKALGEGLPQDQAKQVLQQDPFYQTLALGVGQPEADRYNQHLLNSLGSEGTNERLTALEHRVQSLESFNPQLSSQLEILNQKLDRLSQSKAFASQSPQLNQFLGNVQASVQQAGKNLGDRFGNLSTQVNQHLHQLRESISNTWQAAKTGLRQKAGEVSLSVVNASARASTQWFGEESKEGLRVIDVRNGQRLGLNQQGDIQVARGPEVQAASEFKRLSQGVEANLPPSVQAKQVAQAALKEQFTTSQVQSILSQAPKFKEISSSQGSDKANQFAGVAIAAAQRQNAIDSQPKQRELQSQKQLQA